MFESLLDQLVKLGFTRETASDIAKGVIFYGGRILIVILILFAAYVVSKWLQSAVRKGLRKLEVDITLARFGANVIRWAILLFTFIICLNIFGVETTSFAAVIGAASLAIGMAFQGSLGNVAAGIMLLIFRPYKVGDYIEVCDTDGIVDTIELFFTVLDTVDNRRIIVPNGKIFGGIIENKTYHDRRRLDFTVGVAYEADIDITRDTLQRAAKVEHVSEVKVVLVALNSSSVDWSVRVWVPTEQYWTVRESLIRSIKYELENDGIDIPYPHTVLVNKP